MESPASASEDTSEIFTAADHAIVGGYESTQSTTMRINIHTVILGNATLTEGSYFSLAGYYLEEFAMTENYES